MRYVQNCPINPHANGGLFGHYKMMQKILKMTKTLSHGYSFESIQRELSNENQHDRVSMVFIIARSILFAGIFGLPVRFHLGSPLAKSANLSLVQFPDLANQLSHDGSKG